MFYIIFRRKQLFIGRVIIKLLTNIKLLINLRVDTLTSLSIFGLINFDLCVPFILFLFKNLIKLKWRMKLIKLIFFHLIDFQTNLLYKKHNNLLHFGHSIQKYFYFFVVVFILNLQGVNNGFNLAITDNWTCLWVPYLTLRVIENVIFYSLKLFQKKINSLLFNF